MLIILGPAKTIDSSPHGITEKHTYPKFLRGAGILADQIKKMNAGELKILLKTNDSLTRLNYDRYAVWKKEYSRAESYHALLSFAGEVFNGLQAREMNESDLLFAQDHVRLLSGLYGVLRPLDLILPYRLEMGTALKTSRGKNLYDFWSEVIPAEIRLETSRQSTPLLINLASGEYFKAIQPTSFPFPVITPVFKESDGPGFRNVTIYAKRARGMMLRFIIKNRITNPENLKAFDEEGYYFHNQLSSKNEWVFCR